MESSSLDVLAESLDMKIQVLRDIEEYNRIQKEVFENDNPNIEDFDEAIENKTQLIDRLEKLDEGFETLYAKLSGDIKKNKDIYAEKIKEIQHKISEITALCVSVQASEARNKKLVESYFAKERQNVRNSRVGSKAAYDYYRNMSGMNVVGPQFMDSKN